MKKESRAFVAITTVLVVAIAIWLMLIGQAFVHLNESLLAQSWRAGLATEMTARACLNIAYRAIIVNPGYAGQNLSWSENSCIIEVLASGNDYQIRVRARVGDYYKKIETRASVASGRLTVNNWQEAE